MRIRQFIPLIIALLSLTACGNKGPVRPLEVPLPGTVQAPELRQQGDALRLGWQLPTSNLDGSALQQPPVVDIYRMTYDPQDDCPECFDRSTLLATINPSLPQPAQRVGQRYLLHDRPLRPGTGYQYKLVARTENGDLSKPVILRLDYQQPPPAPQQVRGTPHDRSVSLQWQSPTLAPDDRLIGYLVYRRLDDTDSPYPLTPQPLTESRFEDFSLDNDTRYHYRVRALVKRGDQQIEGLASTELRATPKAGI
jgi:predicted small lipoprotein YifL